MTLLDHQIEQRKGSGNWCMKPRQRLREFHHRIGQCSYRRHYAGGQESFPIANPVEVVAEISPAGIFDVIETSAEYIDHRERFAQTHDSSPYAFVGARGLGRPADTLACDHNCINLVERNNSMMQPRSAFSACVGVGASCHSRGYQFLFRNPQQSTDIFRHFLTKLSDGNSEQQQKSLGPSKPRQTSRRSASLPSAMRRAFWPVSLNRQQRLLLRLSLS